MPKSFVLTALRIFGFEEMLNLSQARKVKTNLLKKAAGEDLVVWNDAPESKPSPQEDNILPFKKSSVLEQEAYRPTEPPAEESESASSSMLGSDFILWQRELNKDSAAPRSKKEAIKGYSKSTEMYVVKESSADGNEKIRFASTRGVLVNKKQA